MNSWLLLQSGACPSAFNMALDEALLEAMPRLGKPVLRFYGWTEPAATFGYFQKYTDVEHTTLLRPLIRRPTGGGIVPHDVDWTYSLAFPPGHEWYLLKAEKSYRRVHEWIRSAFTKLNVITELAPSRKKTATGECFVGYTKFDLLWNGKKIAGAAQRRNKSGLLVQGSVQPPPILLLRVDWEKAVVEVARRDFNIAWMELLSDTKLRGRADELVRKKYSQETHNHKR